MTRIGIIFLLISWTYGDNCNLSNRNLTELENAFIEADNYTTRVGLHKDAIICIGATRAGKSTLINYLIGNELKGFKKSKFDEYKIIKANNESYGPEIGLGPKSKTTIPTKWTSNKLSGFSIFDTPGFDDNRGPVQDITNSFYLYLLIRKVNSLKFILVIDFGDIERDITLPFFKILRNFKNFFGYTFPMFFSSISVIFTKVPSKIDETKVDIEMIKHLLSIKADAIKNKSSINLNNFLEGIIKNSGHIALFRKAEKNKINSSDIDFNIFPAINNSKSVSSSVLHNITPTASQESKLCLYYAKDKWISMWEFNEIKQSLLNLSNSILVDSKNLINQNIYPAKEIYKLSYCQRVSNKIIKNEFDVYKLIETIEIVDDKMKNTIKKINLLTKVKIFYFVSRLLKSNDIKELHRFFEDLRLRLRLKLKMFLIFYLKFIGDRKVRKKKISSLNTLVTM